MESQLSKEKDTTHRQNLQISDLKHSEDKLKQEIQKLMFSQNGNQPGNFSQITVSTKNRFEALLTDSDNEDMTIKQPNNDVNLTNIQQQETETIDALIICDSHGNNLNEEKLYKYRKVKVCVLDKGEKNLQGAKKFLDNTSIKYKNLMIMVGSNDISQGASPTKI